MIPIVEDFEPKREVSSRSIDRRGFYSHTPIVKGDVIYCRISDEVQGRRNAHNLSTQQKKCRDHTKHDAQPVIKVFVDQESGRTTDRTNPQEMLTYCGKNRGIVARVVVADLSRLARNVSD